MKTILAILFIVMSIALIAPAAYSADGTTALALIAKGDRPDRLVPAMDPPDGAKITILSHGNMRTVIVTGFPEVYKNRVEIYGKSDGIEGCPLVNGQCTYRAGRWLNFPFKVTADSFAYVHVADQYRAAKQPWQGPGVCIMPDFGKGSAIISCDDINPEYK